jgi:hypothetical protein
MRHKLRHPAGIIFTVTGMLCTPATYALGVSNSTISATEWTKADAVISITMDSEPLATEGQLKFFIGSLDITALIHTPRPNEYVYDGTRLPLPSGESEVILYLAKNDNTWQEIARLPIKVLTATGFEQSVGNVTVNLNLKGQLDEGHSGTVTPPQRHTFQDLAGQINVNTQGKRGNLQLVGTMNLVGSSFQNEALRFGTLGNNAPNLDLSDYLLQMNTETNETRLGHITYGTNRFLLNNMASRGITFKQKIDSQLDFSIVSMSGNSIAGYDNIFGLDDSNNNISALSIGYEINEQRPGAMRIELMYLDASLQPRSNFDSGEIRDAETSNGTGLRLSGSDTDQRLLAELSLAQSRFNNPNDPLLTQTTALVPLLETTNNARHAQVSYGLLKDVKFGQEHNLNVTATLTHERIDPFYKSIGAFTNANQMNTQTAFSINIDRVAMQLSHQEIEDNLDNIATVIKTKTRGNNVNITLPLASFFDSKNETSFSVWPTLQYAYNQIHQFGTNVPVTFDANSHIPDQLNSQHNLGLQWSFETWNIGYQFGLSDQDNRQPARALADFETRTHGLNIALRLSEQVNLNLGYARSRAFNNEIDLISYNNSYLLGMDWRFAEHWSFNGNYSVTSADDSQNLTLTDGYTAQSQINWNTDIAGSEGKKLPMQVFLRHAVQNNENINNTFGLNTKAYTWTVNSGVNISF